MATIEINHVNKRYGRQEVLKDLTIHADAGSIVGLLGPNGCGKSTLLKIMAGLISDYDGEVSISGKPVGLETKSMVSYLPEKTYLPGWMRPQDIFALFSDFYSDFDRRLAEDMLGQFNIGLNQQAKNMSKGMQEKLQLTLVMSRKARVYLLDEPLGGVDPAARSAILDLVLKNYQAESVMILATHLIQDVEKIFDRAVILGFGEKILDDETDAIRQNYGKSIDEVFREVFKCSLNL